jgi:hypothetical protein
MRTHLDLIAFAAVASLTAACSSGGSGSTDATSTGAGGESTMTTTSGGTASTGTGSVASSVIATGLFHPNDLAIFDSNVYWATDSAAINKIAVAGGAPQAILPDAHATALAVDATGVYWITGSPPVIMHAGLDGSGQNMVTSFDSANGGILGLVGGTLYFSGTIAPSPGILSVPTAGGAPTMLHAGSAVQALRLADSSGLAWEEPATSPPASTLMHAGLDGNGAAAIVTLNIGTKQYLRGVSSDGTSVFYGVRDQTGSPNTSYLYKIAAAGGAAEKLFTFTGELNDNVGDAKGLYFGDDRYETAGVYLAHADGTTSDLIDGEHSPGNIRFMHLDATYLVWMDGDDSGQTRLHAVAR